MKRAIMPALAAGLCLWLSPAFAGKPAGQPAADAGLSIIARKTIEAHVEFLASDALEGREAGKPGGRVAAEYIRAELKKNGVKPFFDTYLQRFEAYSPAREKGGAFQVHPDSIAAYKRLSAHRKLRLQNVVGYIEGRQSNEFVVLGAHYDHLGVDDLLVGDPIYNGADDNASSVAALLQVAQAFAASGKKPQRSIIFAFWDGEEINYLGSEYFVQSFGNPAHIKANINLDMVGREGLMPVLYPEFSIPEATPENTATGSQLHLLYTEDLAAAAAHLQAAIRDGGLQIAPRPAVIARRSRGSDYFAFTLRGVPVLWFFTGLHPDYHTPGDEADRLNLDKVTEIAKATYLAALYLANT